MDVSSTKAMQNNGNIITILNLEEYKPASEYLDFLINGIGKQICSFVK